ncbi:MAG: ATP-grasp domain-containing protein [Nitriliruptor sp.]|nr:MAG: ATP-grasp domain-containing protein [Nitriliruptor sp.]
MQQRPNDGSGNGGNGGAERRPFAAEEVLPRPHPSSTLSAPLRIAVLMGGANSERYASLSSGVAIARALRWVGHAVAAVDSAQAPIVADRRVDHAFLTAEVEQEDIPETPVSPTVAIPPDLDALAEVRSRQEDGVMAPGLLPILAAADVVFVTTFGDEGEMGNSQRYLEQHAIVYTGPTPEVCDLTFDKVRTKELVTEHGIDTPAWHLVRRDRIEEDLRELTLPGPWIVKPHAGGSTIGLSKVDDPAQLPAACRLAIAEGRDALIEEFVPGRDLTIAALGDRVFAIVEPLSDHEVFSYEAKYTPGESRKEVPANLSPEDTARVRRLTGQVHQVLGIGEATSRADFRLAADGRLVFLETNPLPGMTPRSSYPMSAAAEGMSFPELCEDIVVRALRRAGRSVAEPQG